MHLTFWFCLTTFIDSWVISNFDREEHSNGLARFTFPQKNTFTKGRRRNMIVYKSEGFRVVGVIENQWATGFH